MFDSETFLERAVISGDNFHYFEEMASSNDYAAELVTKGYGSGNLVLAEVQSAGRGRGGNSWVCPAGNGLLFSLVLEPNIAKKYWPRLALASGLAVAQVLEKYIDGVEIKWPNDVWIRGKKCGGVLIEGAGDCVIVGVGINVSVVDFPQELEKSATSLAREGVMNISREVLLAEIIIGIFRWGSCCGGSYSQVVKEVRRRCALTGRRIKMIYDGERIEGVMIGLSDEGYLLLECGSERMSIPQADEVRLA